MAAKRKRAVLMDLPDRWSPVRDGRYVVAEKVPSKRAVCWASRVDGAVLRAIFEEVDARGLARPITVFGHVCTVSETRSFRFDQVSGEVAGFFPAFPPKPRSGAKSEGR